MNNVLPLGFGSRLSSAVFFSLLALGASPVHAQKQLTGVYSGALYSESSDKFEPDNGGDTQEETRGHLKYKLGMELASHLAVEGQIGMTTNSSSDRGILTLGGYLQAFKKFEKYKVYGLLGYSGIWAYDDASDDVDENGVSYGLGIEIFGSTDMAISIEYMSVLDVSVESDNPTFSSGDVSFQTLGIGFTYYFNDESSAFARNQKRLDSIRY